MGNRFFLAAVLPLVAAGCGGGGSSTPPAPGTGVSGKTSTPVIDGVAQKSVSSPAGSPQPITITVNGQSETDLVPGGESVAQGQSVVLIPATLPVYLTRGANGNAEIYFAASAAAMDTGATHLGAAIHPAQPNIDTGLHALNGQIVSLNGTVYPHYVLGYPAPGTSRNISMVFEGPLQVGSSPFLTINSGVELGFELSNDGNLGPGQQATYPTGALYALPANGTSLYESFLEVTLGRLKATSPITTTVTLGWTGVTKNETRYTSGGVTTIWAADQHANDAIPANGIATASMVLQAP